MLKSSTHAMRDKSYDLWDAARSHNGNNPTSHKSCRAYAIFKNCRIIVALIGAMFIVYGITLFSLVATHLQQSNKYCNILQEDK